MKSSKRDQFIPSVYSDTSEGEFSLHEKFPALSQGISQVAIAAQTQNTSV